MKINLAVIGLDRIGVSIGMVLGKKGTEMQCTGFDPDPKKVEAAKKLQAFDQITFKTG